MVEEDFSSNKGRVVYDALREAYNLSRGILEVDRRFQKLMKERGYHKVGSDEPVWKVENWEPERPKQQ